MILSALRVCPGDSCETERFGRTALRRTQRDTGGCANGRDHLAGEGYPCQPRVPVGPGTRRNPVKPGSVRQPPQQRITLGFLEDLGLLADEVKQTEGRAGRPPAPFLPTDGRYLGHIEQTCEHRLTDVELLA